MRTTLPAPVSYGGMPADRFWEIEDATVRFGGLDTGRTELARMLLAEFALTFGNDWFVVPIDLPVGSVTSIDSFTVTDSFGVPTHVSRSAPPGGGFRMFETDAPAGPQRVQGLFLLAPTTAEVAESPPTEHVVFFRDELANVVWGVERTYQGGAGTPVDRFEQHQRQLGEQQQIDTETGDAQLLYRLQTDVPDHWHPFVPVRAAGIAPTQGVIQLERRPLVRVLPDGTSFAPQPRGRVLTAREAAAARGGGSARATAPRWSRRSSSPAGATAATTCGRGCTAPPVPARAAATSAPTWCSRCSAPDGATLRTSGGVDGAAGSALAEAASAWAVPGRLRRVHPSMLRCGPALTAEGSGRHVLADHAAGARARAVPDVHRGDEGVVARRTRVPADDGAVLLDAVVVGEHRAGADVAPLADLRVPDVRQVRHLGAVADLRVLGLHEAADLAVGTELGAGTEVGERADVGPGADDRQLGMGAYDVGTRAHLDVLERAVRSDDGVLRHDGGAEQLHARAGS